MDSQDSVAFYVSDPQEEKDSFGKFISYLLKGAKIFEPLPRRYREFDLLRTKLCERFPGVWIPPLPEKKLVGNKSKNTVETRIEQINRFCKLVAQNPILLNSQETQAFLTNVSSIEKMLNGFQKENYQEMLARYKGIFNKPSEFNGANSVNEQDQYINSVKNTLSKLNEIKDKIKDMKAKDAKVPELFKKTLEMFIAFENEGLVEYADNDKSKYILYKCPDKQLLESLRIFHEKYTNPFDDLNEKVNNDIMDSEALIEAYNIISEYKKAKEKMLKNNQSGTPECTALTELLDLITYSFSLECQKMKKFFIEDYYRELGEIQKAVASNTKNMMKCGYLITENRNIKEMEEEYLQQQQEQK